MRTLHSRSNKKNEQTFEIAQEHGSLTCGVYEKISKVCIGGRKEWKTSKRFIESILEDEDEFVDKEFPPSEQSLLPLARRNTKIAKSMGWFRLHKFYKKEKYSVMSKIQIQKQVITNRGYVYLIDAFNVLSTQPGLVQRLFERKKTSREGVYGVWLNFNGKWQSVVVDDFMPVFVDRNNKNQFFFSAPSFISKEIWYCLLEKAMAKLYGGYINLFNGFENYAVRDLTGAPHIMHDVPLVNPSMETRKREVEHLDSMWNKITKNLKKGYILSAVPRLPNQKEKLEHEGLNIHNKKYYLNHGLYSGHNVAILTAKAVQDAEGNQHRLIKIRNPWINEVWKGEWSKNSPNWTNKLRSELNYFPEEQGDSVFWIPINYFMWFYECLNVYKTTPGFTYNSTKIPINGQEFNRKVVRISVQKKGKYTFSINQKDLRGFVDKSLTYCPVKLTLGKIEKNEFKLLSHTSSKKLRNTHIRKLIEKGEYYMLVEKINTKENLVFYQKNRKEKQFENFLDISISSYGPQTCAMTTLKKSKKTNMFDSLCYYGWKGYSRQRIGQKISEFKVNFYDGSWNMMSLFLLKIPDSFIYAFKNDNQFGVELTAKVAQKDHKEILGPEGAINFEQEFSMNAGESDVFILRETCDFVDNREYLNSKFQIRSVIGRKYRGEKEDQPRFELVKSELLKAKVSSRVCEVERNGHSKKSGLYDMTDRRKKMKQKEDEEIRQRVKRYFSPINNREAGDRVDMDELKRMRSATLEKKKKIERDKKRAAEERKRIAEENRKEEERIKRIKEAPAQTVIQQQLEKEKKEAETRKDAGASSGPGNGQLEQGGEAAGQQVPGLTPQQQAQLAAQEKALAEQRALTEQIAAQKRALMEQQRELAALQTLPPAQQLLEQAGQAGLTESQFIRVQQEKDLKSAAAEAQPEFKPPTKEIKKNVDFNTDKIYIEEELPGPRSQQRGRTPGKNRARSRSILKNNNKNHKIEFDNVKALDQLDKLVEDITEVDELTVSQIMNTKGPLLLNLTNYQLKHLIKYFGIHSFMSIYQVNQTLVFQILEKLKKDDNSEKSKGAKTAQQQSHQDQLELQKELLKQLEEQKKLADMINNQGVRESEMRTSVEEEDEISIPHSNANTIPMNHSPGPQHLPPAETPQSHRSPNDGSTKVKKGGNHNGDQAKLTPLPRRPHEQKLKNLMKPTLPTNQGGYFDPESLYYNKFNSPSNKETLMKKKKGGGGLLRNQNDSPAQDSSQGLNVQSPTSNLSNSFTSVPHSNQANDEIPTSPKSIRELLAKGLAHGGLQTPKGPGLASSIKLRQGAGAQGLQFLKSNSLPIQIDSQDPNGLSRRDGGGEGRMLPDDPTELYYNKLRKTKSPDIYKRFKQRNPTTYPAGNGGDGGSAQGLADDELSRRTGEENSLRTAENSYKPSRKNQADLRLQVGRNPKFRGEDTLSVTNTDLNSGFAPEQAISPLSPRTRLGASNHSQAINSDAGQDTRQLNTHSSGNLRANESRFAKKDKQSFYGAKGNNRHSFQHQLPPGIPRVPGNNPYQSMGGVNPGIHYQKEKTGKIDFQHDSAEVLEQTDIIPFISPYNGPKKSRGAPPSNQNSNNRSYQHYPTQSQKSPLNRSHRALGNEPSLNDEVEIDGAIVSSYTTKRDRNLKKKRRKKKSAKKSKNKYKGLSDQFKFESMGRKSTPMYPGDGSRKLNFQKNEGQGYSFPPEAGNSGQQGLKESHHTLGRSPGMLREAKHHKSSRSFQKTKNLENLNNLMTSMSPEPVFLAKTRSSQAKTSGNYHSANSPQLASGKGKLAQSLIPGQLGGNQLPKVAQMSQELSVPQPISDVGNLRGSAQNLAPRGQRKQNQVFRESLDPRMAGDVNTGRFTNKKMRHAMNTIISNSKNLGASSVQNLQPERSLKGSNLASLLSPAQNYPMRKSSNKQSMRSPNNNSKVLGEGESNFQSPRPAGLPTGPTQSFLSPSTQNRDVVKYSGGGYEKGGSSNYRQYNNDFSIKGTPAGGQPRLPQRKIEDYAPSNRRSLNEMRAEIRGSYQQQQTHQALGSHQKNKPSHSYYKSPTQRKSIDIENSGNKGSLIIDVGTGNFQVTNQSPNQNFGRKPLSARHKNQVSSSNQKQQDRVLYTSRYNDMSLLNPNNIPNATGNPNNSSGRQSRQLSTQNLKVASRDHSRSHSYRTLHQSNHGHNQPQPEKQVHGAPSGGYSRHPAYQQNKRARASSPMYPQGVVGGHHRQTAHQEQQAMKMSLVGGPGGGRARGSQYMGSSIVGGQNIGNMKNSLIPADQTASSGLGGANQPSSTSRMIGRYDDKVQRRSYTPKVNASNLNISGLKNQLNSMGISGRGANVPRKSTEMNSRVNMYQSGAPSGGQSGGNQNLAQSGYMAGRR